MPLNSSIDHSKLKYRPDIDGLRALAISLVVIFHAYPSDLSGGYIGVDVFFVISGFLITGLIYKNLKEDKFSFYDFYARRIRRILPALTLTLISCLVLGWFILLPDEYSRLSRHVMYSSIFMQNFALIKESGYFDINSNLKPLLHIWSLAIEEQFYIFFPLFLFTLKKANVGILFPIFTLFIISFFLNLFETDRNQTFAFYLPYTRFWELMVGALTSCLTHSQKADRVFGAIKTRISENYWAIAGVALTAFAAVHFGGKTLFPGWRALIPTIGTALIILAGERAWINRRILTLRPIIYLGLISYPLYIWHWPILSFLHILFGNEIPRDFIINALVASLGLAIITYELIEKPIRHNQNKAIAPVILTIALSIGASGLAIHRLVGIPSREVAIENHWNEQNITYESNKASRCTIDPKLSMVDKFCVSYIAPNSEKTVLLWGDSSTEAWAPVFRDIGKKRGYSVIVISHPSCPPIIDARKTEFRYPESKYYCSNGNIQRQAIKLIQEEKPDYIILNGAWNIYSNDEFISDRPVLAATMQTSIETMKDRLPETIDILSRVGNVIVFKSWPMFPTKPNYQIRRLSFLQGIKPISEVDVQSFQIRSELVNSVFASTNESNVDFFDPAKKMCDEDKCYSVLNNVKMYNDSYHISPNGSLQFESDIEHLLQ